MVLTGPRWFTEADAIWRVHNDVAMFVGGIRALLLQSLHPVAMAAVSAHSGFRGDPWGRLHRTSHFLATTTYGTIDDAERNIAKVNANHGRIRGRTPEGVAYRADDPELLAWIHLAEVDSFLTAYQTLARESLTASEADSYVAQTGMVAAKLGVIEPPVSVDQLGQQLAAYRPGLIDDGGPGDRRSTSSPSADRWFQRAGYTVLAAGAVSLLPMWVRAELGLPSFPITDRVLTRAVTRTALRGLRWALSG